MTDTTQAPTIPLEDLLGNPKYLEASSEDKLKVLGKWEEDTRAKRNQSGDWTPQSWLEFETNVRFHRLAALGVDPGNPEDIAKSIIAEQDREDQAREQKRSKLFQSLEQVEAAQSELDKIRILETLTLGLSNRTLGASKRAEVKYEQGKIVNDIKAKEGAGRIESAKQMLSLLNGSNEVNSVLLDGEWVPKTELYLDRKAYLEELNKSVLTEAEKTRKIAEFDGQAPQVVQFMWEAHRYLFNFKTEGQNFLKQNPDASDAEVLLNYRRSSTASVGINLSAYSRGFVSAAKGLPFLAKLAGQALNIESLETGADKVLAGAGQNDARFSQEVSLLGGGGLGTTLVEGAGNVVGQLGNMMAFGATLGAARGLTLSAVTKAAVRKASTTVAGTLGAKGAADLAARKLTINQFSNLINRVGNFGTISTGAAGAAYYRDYELRRDQLAAQGLSGEALETEAREKALMDATRTGLITGAVSQLFGLRGIEAVGKLGQVATSTTAREVLKKSVKEWVGITAKAALGEGVEEALDEGINGGLDAILMNPGMTYEQWAESILTAGAVGAILGAGVEGAMRLDHITNKVTDNPALAARRSVAQQIRSGGNTQIADALDAATDQAEMNFISDLESLTEVELSNTVTRLGEIDTELEQATDPEKVQELTAERLQLETRLGQTNPLTDTQITQAANIARADLVAQGGMDPDAAASAVVKAVNEIARTGDPVTGKSQIIAKAKEVSQTPTFRDWEGKAVLVENESGIMQVNDEGQAVLKTFDGTEILVANQASQLVTSTNLNVRIDSELEEATAMASELTQLAGKNLSRPIPRLKGPTMSLRSDGNISLKSGNDIVTAKFVESKMDAGDLVVTLENTENGVRFDLIGAEAVAAQLLTNQVISPDQHRQHVQEVVSSTPDANDLQRVLTRYSKETLPTTMKVLDPDARGSVTKADMLVSLNELESFLAKIDSDPNVDENTKQSLRDIANTIFNEVADLDRTIPPDPSKSPAASPVQTPRTPGGGSQEVTSPANREELNVALSASTSTIPGLARLSQEAENGDRTAALMLADIARDSLSVLFADLPGVEVGYENAIGLYGGYLESSLGVNLKFNDVDRPQVLARLARFSINFNQEQFHVRLGVDPSSKLGTRFDDGSFITLRAAWKVGNMTRSEVEGLATKYGITGFTLANGELSTYYAGDPNDSAALSAFRQSIYDLGQNLGGGSLAPARLWVYGIGGISYGSIRGDVPRTKTKHNSVARRIAARIASREVAPVEQAKTLTPQQERTQTRIAKAYEAMRVNALDDPRVRRAYEELATEVLDQFNSMPVKVEILSGQGEPYKNSQEMRQDVLGNNHLFIFGTDPETFGPPGVVYDSHPLLGDSGLTDINGTKLLYNDLLRAVHDYYAHTMTPVQFGVLGEEAAWANHMAMTVSPWARWALTSETRGQNSYVNFGPNGEFNRNNPGQTIFAIQKVDLLPVDYAKTGDPALDAELDVINKYSGKPTGEVLTKLAHTPGSKLLDALSVISADTDSEYSQIASALIRTNRDDLAKVTFRVRSSKDGADRVNRSIYFLSSNTVAMGQGREGRIKTIIHEAVHAITSRKMNRVLKDDNKTGKAYRRALEDAIKDPATPEPLKDLVRVYFSAVEQLGKSGVLWDGGDVSKVTSGNLRGVRPNSDPTKLIFSSRHETATAVKAFLRKMGVSFKADSARKWQSTGVEITIDREAQAALKSAGVLSESGVLSYRWEAVGKGTANRPDAGVKRGVPYGLGNMDEFLAEGFSNPDFQRMLNSTKGDGRRSLWQWLMDSVKKVLGIDVAPGSLLNDLFASSLEFMKIGDSDIPGTAAARFEDDAEIATARFNELTASIPANPTQAQLDSWKTANPAAYAELEQMRAEVLRGAGYNVGPVWHGTTKEFTEFKEPPRPKKDEMFSFGFHLTESQDLSNRYGPKQIRAYVKLANPLDVERIIYKESPEWVWLKSIYPKLKGFPERGTEVAYFRNALDSVDSTKVRKALEASDHDGLIYNAQFQELGPRSMTTLAAGKTYVALNPNQIKSAEPLNLGPDGKLITPDQWADDLNPDIRYSPDEDEVDPALVARHAELEARKDSLTPAELAEAQRIVEQAASAAGFTSEGWHASRGTEDFNVFKAGEQRVDVYDAEKGSRTELKYIPAWFSNRKNYVERIGNLGKPRRFFLRVRNPLDLTNLGEQPTQEQLTAAYESAGIRDVPITHEGFVIMHDEPKGDTIARKVLGAGYDAMKVAEINGAVSTVVWDSSQIKSAEPFTGVPLDQRFNSTSPDIRYSPDEDGFYSVLEQAVEDRLPTRFTAQQAIGTVEGTPGVKAEELKWSGFRQLVARLAEESTDGKINKANLQQALKQEGRVQFEEVVMSEQDLDEAQRTPMFGAPSLTKYAQYQLLGGENYREIVLAMPNNPKTTGFEVIKKATGKSLGVFGTREAVDRYLDQIVEVDGEGVAVQAKQTSEDRDRAVTYTSTHFPGTPNYVAHMRVNERTDAEGQPGLFIEELQSDRHQQGREHGYKDEAVGKEHSALIQRLNDLVERRNDALYAAQEGDEQAAAEYRAIDDEVGGINARIAQLDSAVNFTGVPDAPFRKDWALQLFKRALRDAVASGKRWIGWTVGDTQNDRYDLSKQVDKIKINPDGDDRFVAVYPASGDKLSFKVDSTGTITTPGQFSGKPLSDVIGKEMAEKIMGVETDAEFYGLDLKVGGSGMLGFYDQILPKEIGKYVKQWGASVSKGNLVKTRVQLEVLIDGVWTSRPQDTFENEDSARQAGDFTKRYYRIVPTQGVGTPIWRVSITPEMLDEVSSSGQARYSPDEDLDEDSIPGMIQNLAANYPGLPVQTGQLDGAPASYSNGRVTLDSEFLSKALADKTPDDVRKVIDRLLFHESVHRATVDEFTPTEISDWERSLTDSEKLDVALNYLPRGNYATDSEHLNDAIQWAGLDPDNPPTPETRRRLVHEQLRMVHERFVFGNTSEEEIAFITMNPGMVRRIMNYLSKLLGRLKARWSSVKEPAIFAATTRLQRNIRRLQEHADTGSTDTPQSEADFDPNTATVLNASPWGRKQRVPIWSRPEKGQYKPGGLLTAANKFDRRIFKLIEDSKGSAVRAEKESQFWHDELTIRLKAVHGKDKANWPLDTINTALGRTENKLTGAQIAQVKTFKATQLSSARSAYMAGRAKAAQFAAVGDMAYAALELQTAKANFEASVAAYKSQAEAMETQFRRINRTQARQAQTNALAALDPTIAKTVQEMNTRIKWLGRKLSRSGYISGDLKATITEELGLYLHRSYAIFDQSNWVDFILSDDAEAVVLRNNASRFIRDELVQQQAAANVRAGMTPAMALSSAQASVTVDQVELKLLDYLSVADDSEVGQTLGIDPARPVEIIKHRGSQSAEIRALWGEYRDPVINAVKSHESIARFLANEKALDGIRNLGLSEGWLSDKPAMGADGKPLVEMFPVSGQPLGKSVQNSRYAPLAGLYGPAALRDAFNQTSGFEQQWAWVKFLNRATGYAMATKTSYSIMATARNYLGNPAFLIANGNLNFGTPGKMLRSLKVNMAPAKLRTSEIRKRVARAAELGIIGDSVVAGVIDDLTSGFRADKKAVTLGEKAAKKLGLHHAQHIHSLTSKFYGKMDDVWKYVAFEAELERVRKYRKGASEAEMEVEAADIVRNTMPSYSRRTEITRQVSRIPFLAPFVTFSSEVLRTSGGMVNIGIKHIKEGLETGNSEMTVNGFQRLTGVVIMSAGLASALAVARMMAGFDDEDEEDLRKHLPEWQKNSSILLLPTKEPGKIRYWDVSFMNPYDVLFSPVRALSRGIRNNDPASKTAWDTFKELSDPVMKEQVLFGSIVDALRGVTSSGRKLYTTTDSPSEKLTASANHIYTQALEPGTVTSLKRVQAGVEKRSTAGKAFNTTEEMVAMLTGIRISTVDVQATLGFAANNFEANQRAATSAFTKFANSKGNVTDEEIIDGYRKADRQSRENFKMMYDKVQAAIELGNMTPGEIRRLLKSQRMSEEDIDIVLHGTYRRYEPSDDTLKTARQNGSRFDHDRVSAIRRVLQDTPRILPLDE